MLTDWQESTRGRPRSLAEINRLRRELGVVLRRSARKSQISVIAQPVTAAHLRDDRAKPRITVQPRG